MLKKRLTYIVVSLCVFIIGVIVSILQPVKEMPIQIFLYIAAYFIVGTTDILSAIKSIKQVNLLEEKFLVTAVSILALFKGEYICAVAIMVLYSLGELFLKFSKKSAINTRFSNTYTSITVAIMLGTAIVPIFFGGEFSVWFYKALLVFVIICPLTLTVLKARVAIKSKNKKCT